MMSKVNNQRGLWEFLHGEDNSERDRNNMLGPYEITENEPIPRHLNCVNYDSCLSYAAKNRWQSFSCLGCRVTIGGRFKDLEVNDDTRRVQRRKSR